MMAVFGSCFKNDLKANFNTTSGGTFTPKRIPGVNKSFPHSRRLFSFFGKMIFILFRVKKTFYRHENWHPPVIFSVLLIYAG